MQSAFFRGIILQVKGGGNTANRVDNQPNGEHYGMGVVLLFLVKGNRPRSSLFSLRLMGSHADLITYLPRPKNKTGVNLLTTDAPVTTQKEVGRLIHLHAYMFYSLYAWWGVVLEDKSDNSNDWVG